MNNSIDTRAPFFPNSPTARKEVEKAKQAQILRRNSVERKKELNEFAQKDAKVNIPNQIRDFSKIKKVADATPEVNNADKIARLKAQIQAGNYEPDYDAVADRILATEY